MCIRDRGAGRPALCLPGVYSLSAYSLEEVVARDFILDERPDVIVAVVDAANLERNLYPVSYTHLDVYKRQRLVRG